MHETRFTNLFKVSVWKEKAKTYLDARDVLYFSFLRNISNSSIFPFQVLFENYFSCMYMSIRIFASFLLQDITELLM